MLLQQNKRLAVPQAVAWAALNDTALLQSCIPGCEALEPDGDNGFTVSLTAAVGPVRARFKGRLRIDNALPPTSYSLQFEGQGGAAGHGKGHADIRLEPEGDAATVLHYTAHATVGGKLAQIGSRLVDMAAQKMAADFFERFDAEVARRYLATPAPPPQQQRVPVAAWRRLLEWLKRLLGTAAPNT